MHIRDFRIGEESVLRSVFFSSVHKLASEDYTRDQLEAWAPRQYDEDLWAKRIRNICPFVAEINGSVIGYADLQASGYIDHFFVAGAFSGRGVGMALMEYIHIVAQKRGVVELSSDVSLTAEPFFSKFGFVVESRNLVTVRGVSMSNTRMCKKLETSRVTDGA